MRTISKAPRGCLGFYMYIMKGIRILPLLSPKRTISKAPEGCHGLHTYSIKSKTLRNTIRFTRKYQKPLEIPLISLSNCIEEKEALNFAPVFLVQIHAVMSIVLSPNSDYKTGHCLFLITLHTRTLLSGS